MDVFLGGPGGEEKASGHGQEGRSLDDACFQTVPFVIYYMLICGGFTKEYLQTIFSFVTVVESLLQVSFLPYFQDESMNVILGKT